MKMKLSEIKDDRPYYTTEILDIFDKVGIKCSRNTFDQMCKDGRIPKAYISNGGIKNGWRRMSGDNLKKVIKKLIN